MNWLKQKYQNSAGFRGFVQAAEGGLITGFLMATAGGVDFSKAGLRVAGATILGGVLTAVRNYLVNRPGQPAKPLEGGK